MDNKKGSSIGVCSILGIVFIVLKLCKVITWSWIWVLSPFWIPLLILIIYLIALYNIVK